MKPRERQSVWCCGSNYQRWRFYGDAFPVKPRSHYKHHTHCVHCGQELVWPESRLRAMKPAEKKEHRRKIELAAQRRLVARRAEQGLTSRGHRPRRSAPVWSDFERAWRAERATMGVIELAEPECGRLRYEEWSKSRRSL